MSFFGSSPCGFVDALDRPRDPCRARDGVVESIETDETDETDEATHISSAMELIDLTCV